MWAFIRIGGQVLSAIFATVSAVLNIQQVSRPGVRWLWFALAGGIIFLALSWWNQGSQFVENRRLKDTKPKLLPFLDGAQIVVWNNGEAAQVKAQVQFLRSRHLARSLPRGVHELEWGDGYWVQLARGTSGTLTLCNDVGEAPNIGRMLFPRTLFSAAQGGGSNPFIITAGQDGSSPIIDVAISFPSEPSSVGSVPVRYYRIPLTGAPREITAEGAEPLFYDHVRESRKLHKKLFSRIRRVSGVSAYLCRRLPRLATPTEISVQPATTVRFISLTAKLIRIGYHVGIRAALKDVDELSERYLAGVQGVLARRSEPTLHRYHASEFDEAAKQIQVLTTQLQRFEQRMAQCESIIDLELQSELNIALWRLHEAQRTMIAVCDRMMRAAKLALDTQTQSTSQGQRT